MKAPAHYLTLREKCLPVIQGYHRDLLVHDRRLIRSHPQVPFIHIARDHGTYIAMLRPAESYPADGVSVPYLFSTADRWHLLKECGSIVEFAEKNHPLAMVHHFDGRTIHPITYTQARHIITEYKNTIIRQWEIETPSWKRADFDSSRRRNAA